MKIIVAFGGLGNVMFYYALANAFRQKGVTSFVFYSKTNLEHRNYALSSIFPKISMWGNLNWAQKAYYSFAQKLRGFKYKKYKIPHRWLFFPYSGLYYDQHPVKYIPTVFDNLGKNEYLIGHFQSYKYFEDSRDSILKEFTFSTKALSEKTRLLSKEILENNSVSIHIRRGDYLNGYYYESLGKICNLEYYDQSIRIINDRVHFPHFYFFSDDFDFVKENIKIENATYVDFNRGCDSWQDMYLMSLCKHNIIANSTFSWWGAWLNQNPSKIVIAPKKWFANIKNDEIVLPDWLRV